MTDDKVCCFAYNSVIYWPKETKARSIEQSEPEVYV